MNLKFAVNDLSSVLIPNITGHNLATSTRFPLNGIVLVFSVSVLIWILEMWMYCMGIALSWIFKCEELKIGLQYSISAGVAI